jgi:hypothetical protein
VIKEQGLQVRLPTFYEKRLKEKLNDEEMKIMTVVKVLVLDLSKEEEEFRPFEKGLTEFHSLKLVKSNQLEPELKKH